MKKRILFTFVFLLPFSVGAENSQTGEELYTMYCSACHSLEPPPKAAPPVRGLIRQYVEHYETEDKFVDAIVDFVLEPEDRESLCTPARERFGDMPELPIAKGDLKKIAAWFWEEKSLWPGYLQ